MERKKIISALIIIMSIVSAVLTIRFALEIVNKMINSELGFIKTNPMPLLICLLIGGTVSFFSLSKVKKVFLTIGTYYIGMLLCIACFYYATLAYLSHNGIEYILAYACIGIVMIAVTHMMANVI